MTIQELNKDFKQLMRELKAVVFDPLREETDTLMEGVVAGDQVQKLSACLTGFFGSPVEPQDLAVPAIKALVDNHGGLMSGQTLYCCSVHQKHLGVMLWPWQDGVHTTVKAFSEE